MFFEGQLNEGVLAVLVGTRLLVCRHWMKVNNDFCTTGGSNERMMRNRKSHSNNTKNCSQQLLCFFILKGTHLFPIPAACSSKKIIWNRGMAMQHSYNQKGQRDNQLKDKTRQCCVVYGSYVIFIVPPNQPMGAQQRNSHIQLGLGQWQEKHNVVDGLHQSVVSATHIPI